MFLINNALKKISRDISPFQTLKKNPDSPVF